MTLSENECGYVGFEGFTQYPGFLFFIHLRSRFRSFDRDDLVFIRILSNTP
jgi:hypothetical protein